MPATTPASGQLGPKRYWRHDVAKWWAAPEDRWIVVDQALGSVDPGRSWLTIENLYSEVDRMWKLLQTSHPSAVWDPFTWTWMVARKLPEPPGPGEQPVPGPQPGTDPAAARRRERDRRIAEVNEMYRAGSISRELRDERIGKIMDDYPDLN